MTTRRGVRRNPSSRTDAPGPTAEGVRVEPGGMYTYLYTAALTGTDRISGEATLPGATTPAGPGADGAAFCDYFTLYDVVGLVDGSWPSRKAGRRSAR